MPKKEIETQDRVWDTASLELLEKAKTECIETCFTRMDTQRNQCKFGRGGLCCRICHMGPCKITSRSPRGVCGANADTIVARNFLRLLAELPHIPIMAGIWFYA